MAKVDLIKLANWIDCHFGSSSKAILLFMVCGKVPKPFDAPSDKWDRSRCVELLKACPDWLERLSEIEALKLAGKRSVNGSGFKTVYPWNEQIPLIIKQFHEQNN